MNSLFPNASRTLGRTIDRLQMPWSSRVNWRHLLEQSGLPARARDLIHQVAAQSRLFPWEKAEVTEELIAHFQDGHRSGESFEDLADRFGDPSLTAKLVRNSKLRNRPMYLKLGRIASFGIVGAAVAYIVALIVFHAGKPNPATDYLAIVNEDVVAVPEDQAAWTLYRDVWTRYEFCEGPGGRFEEIYHRDPETNEYLGYVRPEHPGWSAAVSKLEDSEELLECFREASRRPWLGLPLKSKRSEYSAEDRAALFPGEEPDVEYDESWGIDGLSKEADEIMQGSMIGVLLPHIQSFRNAARILYVDTRVALHEEDPDRAVRNIETILGISRHAAEPDFLVCGLVGFAVCGIGYDLIDEVLDEHADAFDNEQLARIQKAVESTPLRDFINFKGERYSIRDLIQRLYTDDGRGDGRMTPVGLEILNTANGMWAFSDNMEISVAEQLVKSRFISGPASLLFMASRKELTEKSDELLDQVIRNFDTPMWEDSGDFNAVEAFLESEEARTKYRVLAELFPAYSQIRSALHRMQGNQRGVALGLAVLRFQRQNAQLPGTAKELVPDYIKAIPVDPADGKPLRYIKTKDGFSIYSIGSDGKDDGGEPIMINQDGSFPPNGVGLVPQPAGSFHFAGQYEGDWIIWPRNSEN